MVGPSGRGGRRLRAMKTSDVGLSAKTTPLSAAWRSQATLGFSSVSGSKNLKTGTAPDFQSLFFAIQAVGLVRPVIVRGCHHRGDPGTGNAGGDRHCREANGRSSADQPGERFVHSTPSQLSIARIDGHQPATRKSRTTSTQQATASTECEPIRSSVQLMQVKTLA